VKRLQSDSDGGEVYSIRLVANSTFKRVPRAQLQPKLASSMEVEELVRRQLDEEERAKDLEATRVHARERAEKQEEELLELQMSLSSSFADDPQFQALPEHGKLRMLEHKARQMRAQQHALWVRRAHRRPNEHHDAGPFCLTPGCDAISYILQENGYCVVCNTAQKQVHYPSP